MRLRDIFGTGAILLALTACGDDPTTVVGAPDGDLPRRPVASATILVSGAEGPIANAGIVIETIDGAILEQTTDRRGLVDLLVPIEEIRSVLAHRDGHGFAAISGKALSKNMQTRTGVQLFLPELEGKALKNVNGFAWNKTSDDSWLTVTATAPGATSYQAPGNAFFLRVPPNEAMQIIGLDWDPATDPYKGVDQTFFGWSILAFYSRDGATVNLDFGQSLPSETVEGSFYAPALYDDIQDFQGAYALVTTAESQGAAFLGAPTALALNERHLDFAQAIEESAPPSGWNKDTTPPVVDFPYAMMAQAEEAGVTPHMELASRIVGNLFMPVVVNPLKGDALQDAAREGVRATYTMSYLPLEGATLVTQYFIYGSKGYAGIVDKGAPIAGHSGLEAPALITVDKYPAPSIHEGVTWDTETVELPNAFVDVYDETGTRVGWMMGNADEGRAHCPPLPTTSTDVLFEGPLTARVMTCQPSADLPGWCGAFSYTNNFTVVP